VKKFFGKVLQNVAKMVTYKVLFLNVVITNTTQDVKTIEDIKVLIGISKKTMTN
jgi:hypothetical protein